MDDPDSGEYGKTPTTRHKGVWKYTYDKNGNLIEPDRWPRARKIEFDYDALNRMIVKRLPSGEPGEGKLRPTTMGPGPMVGACL